MGYVVSTWKFKNLSAFESIDVQTARRMGVNNVFVLPQVLPSVRHENIRPLVRNIVKMQDKFSCVSVFIDVKRPKMFAKVKFAIVKVLFRVRSMLKQRIENKKLVLFESGHFIVFNGIVLHFDINNVDLWKLLVFKYFLKIKDKVHKFVVEFFVVVFNIVNKFFAPRYVFKIKFLF